MYEGLGKSLKDFTVSSDFAVDVLLNRQPYDLRNNTSTPRVRLPQDLYAHRDAQTEWWYYTGHCETASGKRFGFELVFFKRRTDFDRLGFLPLKLLANPAYAAHFAITEIDRESFRYEHRKSFNRSLDLPAGASENRYDLFLGGWKAQEKNGRHILQAQLGKDLIFRAALQPTKPASLNGHQGIGISHKDEGEIAHHFSFTRMKAEGEITVDGLTEAFSGSAWMDREFGTWNQKNWDWFSIQLDDNTELMIYRFRNDSGGHSPFSNGAFIDRFGDSIYLTHDDFTLESTGSWKSRKTGAVYPSGWRICVPHLEIDLQITPVIQDQELDTRRTTMIVYWEGACDVSGRRGAESVGGRAYAELVGYERSHEKPSLRKFLWGGLIRNFRQRFFSKNVTQY